VQVTTVGRAIQRLLYERTVASQGAALSSLVEDMAAQRSREVRVLWRRRARLRQGFVLEKTFLNPRSSAHPPRPRTLPDS
jgi:hypothetical protein